MSAPGIGHNNNSRSDDLRRRYEANVVAISSWVGQRRIDEALTRHQLGALTGLDRLVTLRNATLDGLHQFYVTNPMADAAPGVFAVVCLLSDNSDGCCTVSSERLAQFLNRTGRRIREAIDRLEADGCVKTLRRPGATAMVWPVINPVYAQHRDPLTWVLDAHAPTSRHVARTAAPASEPRTPASRVNEHTEPQPRTPASRVENAAPWTPVTPTPDTCVQGPWTPASSYTAIAIDTAKSSRGTRLPPDWKLPPDWRDWALSHHVITDQQAQTESETFRDYWIARPGSHGSKLDWYATWRNWIRRNYAARASAAAGGPAPVDGKSWGWWRGQEAVFRALPLETWETAVGESVPGQSWPWWTLGPEPGHPECVVPAALANKLRRERVHP